MRYVADLTGTGSAAQSIEMNGEVAYCAWVYMGRGPRGGKQILRKYIKAGQVHGTGASAQMANGMATLGTAQKTPIIDALNALKTVSAGGVANVDICNPAGKHLPAGSVWDVLPYLTTRQFRRRGKRRAATAA
jgi:hypothetical protein